MKFLQKALCVVFLLVAALGCEKPAEVTLQYPSKSINLPVGSSVDTQGVLIGPHGGSLTRAGDFFLESVFLPNGVVQIYAYDSIGESIPVSALNIAQISLQTNQGTIVVTLKPVDTYYLVGYYDYGYYGPFLFGAYSYFYIVYPDVIIIRDIPCNIYQPPYHNGVGSNPKQTDTNKGYPTKSQKGYPTQPKTIVAPAPYKATLPPKKREREA